MKSKESNVNESSLDEKLHLKDLSIEKLASSLKINQEELNRKLSTIHELEKELKEEKAYIYRKKSDWSIKKHEYKQLKSDLS